MGRLIGVFSVVVGAGITFGCATKYGRMGIRGGYSETQITATTFRVEFRGNGYTPRSRVENSLLYRCAELTLQHGYDYFVLLDSQTEGRMSDYETPGTYNGSSTVVGNQGYASGTYTPGTRMQFTKYGATALIRVFRGQKPEHLGFEAREVASYVGPQIGASSHQAGESAPHPLGPGPGTPSPDSMSGQIGSLLDLLNSDDKGLREKAAKGLGKLGVGASAAVGPLTTALADAHWSVRLEAAQALGRIGSGASAAVPQLVAVAAKDGNAPTRAIAERAILKIGSASVPQLTETLRSPDPRIQEKASTLLKKLL